ncbi:MAG: GNAT family N-acetyltransferase [Planctomycetota bacterium]
MKASRQSTRVSLLTTHDVALYRALMLEAYASAPDAFTSTLEERAAEPESWWIKRIADPAGTTAAFGAFRDSELVGAVALEFSRKPKTRHKAVLIGMYVKPTARSAGVGRLLVDTALAHVARCPEVRVITLTVTHGNVAAESLYRSVGFEPFGLEPDAMRGSRGALAKVHMIKTMEVHVDRTERGCEAAGRDATPEPGMMHDSRNALANRPSRVTIHMAASLDGFIARRDGSVDWMETADDFADGHPLDPEVTETFLKTIDCYVMGSRTYETALRFESQGLGWAYGDKPVFVLTTRELPRSRDTIEFCSGDLAQIVNVRLRPAFRSIWIVGGGVVAAECVRLGLADEVSYSILPVLIGDGISFFERLDRDVALHLAEVKAYKSGVVELRYEVRRGGA